MLDDFPIGIAGDVKVVDCFYNLCLDFVYDYLVVFIPLISIGGTQLIKLINSKIKNNKASKLLATATEIVINAVRSVFQTYVESLKETGKFDAQCQITALNKAKEVALHQMTTDVTGFITETYGDVDNWLTIQIEATINALKNR